MQKPPKIPESVLVVIHTPELDVLIIERADHKGFWQSVTGSKDHIDEPLIETAAREVQEETGIVIGSALVPETRCSTGITAFSTRFIRNGGIATRKGSCATLSISSACSCHIVSK